jgi:hypothetical protein
VRSSAVPSRAAPLADTPPRALPPHPTAWPWRPPAHTTHSAHTAPSCCVLGRHALISVGICYVTMSLFCGLAGKALGLAGDSVKAHYLLANAHLNLEHFDDAEASFQRALALANTPESAGYRASVESGLYSLYASRKEQETAVVGMEDGENRRIIDDMLQEAYQIEAATNGGEEEEASSRHAARTQKVGSICILQRVCVSAYPPVYLGAHVDTSTIRRRPYWAATETILRCARDWKRRTFWNLGELGRTQ